MLVRIGFSRRCLAAFEKTVKFAGCDGRERKVSIPGLDDFRIVRMSVFLPCSEQKYDGTLSNKAFLQ